MIKTQTERSYCKKAHWLTLVGEQCKCFPQSAFFRAWPRPLKSSRYFFKESLFPWVILVGTREDFRSVPTVWKTRHVLLRPSWCLPARGLGDKHSPWAPDHTSRGAVRHRLMNFVGRESRGDLGGRPNVSDIHQNLTPEEADEIGK